MRIARPTRLAAAVGMDFAVSFCARATHTKKKPYFLEFCGVWGGVRQKKSQGEKQTKEKSRNPS